jgi:hypothetical protein
MPLSPGQLLRAAALLSSFETLDGSGSGELLELIGQAGTLTELVGQGLEAPLPVEQATFFAVYRLLLRLLAYEAELGAVAGPGLSVRLDAASELLARGETGAAELELVAVVDALSSALDSFPPGPRALLAAGLVDLLEL